MWRPRPRESRYGLGARLSSTGEEVYSIAILPAGASGRSRVRHADPDFATDISDEAIRKARELVYAEEEMQEDAGAPTAFLHPGRLKLCSRSGHPRAWRVCSPRRDQRPSLLKNSICSVAAISSKIHSEPLLQKKVLASFHYALKDTGVLLLENRKALT